MNANRNTWALVLAAGEGKRLNSLTTDHRGIAIPKQFCSLNGGRSLLEETLGRAAAIVPKSRIAAVVAEQHEPHWRSSLAGLPAANVVQQPENRGTGNGILLPLLQILDRDPEASLVLLPSDHFIGNERPLRRSIKSALKQIRSGAAGIVLLGIKPDRADPELGYILPGRATAQAACSVLTFIEKPQADVAARLLNAGALWNSFIIAARGQALLDLYLRQFPEVVQAMIDALTQPLALRRRHLRALYERLPEIDFSRHVLDEAEAALSVIPVPVCGWSDLGTPRRVGEALARTRRRLPAPQAPASRYFDLASAWNRLQSAA